MTNQLRFDFAGTSVLVTGGTSGIGHAIASAFARSGADVTVTGTRPDAGHYDVDLSSFSYRSLEMRDHGAVDELAAGSTARRAGQQRRSQLSRRAGRMGPRWLRRRPRPQRGRRHAPDHGAAGRAGRQRHGGGASVVNLVSMTAFRSTTIVPGYAAAKAALLTLTRNLAAYWAADGIRVNAVAPGLIDTPMTAPMQAFPHLLEDELARAILPRWARPPRWRPPSSSSRARPQPSSPAAPSPSTAATSQLKEPPWATSSLSTTWRPRPQRRPADGLDYGESKTPCSRSTPCATPPERDRPGRLRRRGLRRTARAATGRDGRR